MVSTSSLLNLPSDMLSSLTHEGLDLRETGQQLRQLTDNALRSSDTPGIDPATVHQMLGGQGGRVNLII